jgi:phage tail protein X
MSFPETFPLLGVPGTGLGAFPLWFPVAVELDFRGRTAWGEEPVGRHYLCVGGERLDQVAHASYGVQNGALEALLISNPGIAILGVHLPKGLAVLLPDLLASRSASTSREVALWG